MNKHSSCYLDEVGAMECFVYILKSDKNGSYYIGSSSDPEKRLHEHNLGNETYTKRNRPYKIVFTQRFEDINMARKAEMKLKKWKRKDFIEKIIHEGFIKSA